MTRRPWDLYREWRRGRRGRRAALRSIAELFARPDRLKGTALRARHRNRWIYLDHEVDDEGQICRIRFGILRHPRPYAFSPQSHKVIETYTYDPRLHRLEREAGLNVTRRRGLDADD